MDLNPVPFFPPGVLKEETPLKISGSVFSGNSSEVTRTHYMASYDLIKQSSGAATREW